MEAKRNACRLLVRKPEEKRPLGGRVRILVDNSNMDLGETEWIGVDRIGLVQDKSTRWSTIVHAIMNLLVP
jgi:hypothetical protein